MAAYLTKEQVERYLGRSLTMVESSNFETYLEIAQERIEDLLCLSLADYVDDDGALPATLAMLVARVFNAYSEEQKATPNVTSKKVEDFSVSLDVSVTPMGAFASQNRADIMKWSKCQGQVKSGKTRHGRLFPV